MIILCTEEDAMQFFEAKFGFMKKVFYIVNKADRMEQYAWEELLQKYLGLYPVLGEFYLTFEKALKSK